MRTYPDYKLVELAKSQRIVLVGEPRELRGEIRLSNQGAEKVVVREGKLCELTSTALTDRPSRSELAVSIVRILRPGQEVVTPLRVRLDRYTPPGEYQASLAIGKHRYPVELHVTESTELEISPERVVIENRPGERVRKQVVFRNAGNVPLTIGSIGAVALDDELIACRTIRSTLAGAGEDVNTLNEWLSTYLREGSKHLARAGMIFVQNDDGEVILQPGEIRSIGMTIRLPDTLDQGAPYFATAFLYTANLIFAIVPIGGRALQTRASADRPNQKRRERRPSAARERARGGPR